MTERTYLHPDDPDHVFACPRCDSAGCIRERPADAPTRYYCDICYLKFDSAPVERDGDRGHDGLRRDGIPANCAAAKLVEKMRDDPEQTTVYAVADPDSGANVYHTDRDCRYIGAANSAIREWDREDAEEWFDRECHHCANEIDKRGETKDMTFYNGASDADPTIDS